MHLSLLQFLHPFNFLFLPPTPLPFKYFFSIFSGGAYILPVPYEYSFSVLPFALWIS